MALSGVVSDTFCNGYVILSVEWSVVQDILNGTNTYTYKVYCDTSKCKAVYLIDNDNYTYASGLSTPSGNHNINVPSSYKCEKKLIASFTDTKAVGEEAITGTISLTYCPNRHLRVYTSATAYVESNSQMSVNGTITIDGMERTTVADIYGELTLGIENTLLLNRAREEFTHTVSFSCGNVTELICNESTVEKFPFTLPVDLAKQNTKGITLSVTFSVTTYYSNENIGTKTVVKTYTIPSDVIPSCTVKITDASLRNGQQLTDIYGGHIQRQSRFKIVVTPETIYDSPIVSYSVEANGVKYDTAEVTTGLLKTSGANDITVTVTDARGRTSEAVIETVNVIPYTVPIVSRIKVNRCDENGVEQSSSKLNTHIKVTFDAEISSINNINSASYMLTYQKVSGLSQVDVVLTDYASQYSIADGSYIFEADVNSPYEITIKATDDFATGSRVTGGSSAMTIFNVLASGLGLCFGGNATLEMVIENMLLTYPSGGFMFPMLAAGSDLISTRTPNVYIVENGQDISHSPIEEGYTLIVLPGAGTGDYVYIAITGDAAIYINTLTDSSWGSWKSLTLT